MSPHHPHRPTDELITGREAAKRLGVHENTVRNWADAGILPVAEVLPGTRYRRYDPADVEQLKQKMAAQAPAGVTPELRLGARQIAEGLRIAAAALPIGERVGVPGSTPHGAVFTIERDGLLYSVVVLPQEAGASQ
jgi:excisionase family DNA binding protein